jgi:hypothetical protein
MADNDGQINIVPGTQGLGGIFVFTPLGVEILPHGHAAVDAA